MGSLDEMFSRLIEQAKEESVSYVTFLGETPPKIDEKEIPLADLLKYCKEKGYEFHCLDEMDRPLGNHLPITSWDEFERIIIKF